MRAEEAISRYRGLLCYVIRPIVGDENLVEDCLSTVQETILQKFDSFDPKKGSLTGWLTKVAHNGALNFVRNRDNQMLAGEAEDMPEGVERKTPDDFLVEKETMEELGRALKRLGSLDANLILRKYYYCQQTAQIAAELGMSPRAVEGRLYRARKKLSDAMKGGRRHD